MSRMKLFLQSFLIYGLGKVVGGIIPIIMLPIITRLMPDTLYFGINDIINVVITICSAIVIMGINESMFRLYFEEASIEHKRKVCSSALSIILFSGLVMFIILLGFKDFFSALFFNSEHSLIMLILALAMYISSIRTIVVEPTRMQNKPKLFLLVNIISYVTSYSVSIYMLIQGEFLLALPLGTLISNGIIAFVFYWLNHKWFKIKKVSFDLIKQLLAIGIPLAPGNVSYWVFVSFDRFMISSMLGNGQLGIYAIGLKVATISQFINAAFSGGWQFFVFSTMKNKDHVNVVSKVYNSFGFVVFISTALVMPFSELIFEVLFTGDYVKGAIVFPYLFLAPLLFILYQTAANQFMVIKKSWPITAVLLIGTGVNIGLNYFMIPIFGIEGSAIATVVGYMISTGIMSVWVSRLKLLEITQEFKISMIIMLVFTVVMRMEVLPFIFKIGMNVVVIILIVILYKEFLMSILKRVNFIKIVEDRFKKIKKM